MMTDSVTLPPAPDDLSEGLSETDILKMRYQTWLNLIEEKYRAELASREAERAEVVTADTDREKDAWANEYALAQAIQNGYIDVAKSEVERVMTRADFVQRMAAAISGVYVAVLALSYGLSETHDTRLPAQGLATTIFLGLAIFLATAYAAFITKPKDIAAPKGGDLYTFQRERLNTYIKWTRRASIGRRHLLQAAVISLGVGVILLPIPYLNLPLVMVERIVVAGLVLVVLPLILSLFLKEKDSQIE